MAFSQWTEVGAPKPGREYLFLLSFLRLRRYRSLFRFQRWARAIAAQLAEAEGAIGFSLRGHPPSKRFWTLSVWEDEDSLRHFVASGAHREALREIRPLVSETWFIRWHGDGGAVPPDWDEALKSRLSD